jgi:hypothetical protein
MSLVAVCDYCRSVVARTDRELLDQGKVADIADSTSPLQLHLRGTWKGKGFRLVGRVQYLHSAGGRWDEWYVAFADGKWGWLSEAQGRFAMLQHRPLAEESALPDYAELTAGRKFTLGKSGSFTVTEVGRAVVAAAEGELPFSPIQQAEHRFVDLEDPGRLCATIEYGPGGPQVFVGEVVTLSDLGLAEAALKAAPTVTVNALQLNCPHCAGPLALAAPDTAQRVTCPHCRSLLDVQGQKLEYLMTLKPPRPPLRIPLGSQGTFRDVSYTVIGYLRRSVTYDKTYYWQEYLLYAPRLGYRWLVESDQHWSFGQPVSPGAITTVDLQASWDGRAFRMFQRAEATVRQVWGEFYWKVKVGDTTRMSDYVAPPYALSLETSTNADGTSEINATVLEYVPHAEVERAFGVEDLPRGWGVAPNQPNPVTARLFVDWGLTLAGVWLAAWVVGTIRGQSVDTALTLWACGMLSLVPLGSLVYFCNFEYRRWQDSEFSPYHTENDE